MLNNFKDVRLNITPDGMISSAYISSRNKLARFFKFLSSMGSSLIPVDDKLRYSKAFNSPIPAGKLSFVVMFSQVAVWRSKWSGMKNEKFLSMLLLLFEGYDEMIENFLENLKHQIRMQC